MSRSKENSQEFTLSKFPNGHGRVDHYPFDPDSNGPMSIITILHSKNIRYVKIKQEYYVIQP